MTDITAVNQATAAQSASSLGIAGNQQFSTDMFLQLLVTQLRHQDPMSESQDTGELITQLTMFTLLEQVVKLQQTADEQSLMQSNQQALTLLNREVEAVGIDGKPFSGTVSAVDISGSKPYLRIGEYDYPLSSILRVEGGDSDNG
jgi:flagellar basal-body rod modification protein FlgD